MSAPYDYIAFKRDAEAEKEKMANKMANDRPVFIKENLPKRGRILNRSENSRLEKQDVEDNCEERLKRSNAVLDHQKIKKAAKIPAKLANRF